MTEPRFRDCKCGHPKLSHELDLAPQCIAENCTCLGYRPDVLPQPQPSRLAHTPPANVTPMRSTLDALIREGKASDRANTRKLAERVESLAGDLSSRLDADREAAEERRRAQAAKEAVAREVAELEAKLAAAKAKLRGRPVLAAKGKPGPKADAPADGICPDCGQGGLRNVGVHRANKHGWRKDGAA